jgi:hypothetical protein
VILALQLLSLGRYHFDPAFGREDWRGAARYVSRHAPPGSVVVFDKHYVRIPFDRYYRGHARRVGLPEGRAERRPFLARLADHHDGRVVLVVSHAWDTGGQSVRLLSRLLCRRGSRIFRASNGIEVHRFGRCRAGAPASKSSPRSSIFTDSRAPSTLAPTKE